MSDKDGNNTLTWVLPDVVDPADTICVTIRIPNNKWHIMAFKGAMFDLACWWNWERDDAHTATRVARVWRRIFYALKFGCDAPTELAYGDYEDMPRFRDACEHDLYYKGCDDTEHQIAFLDMIPGGGSAGNGAPQPKSGGGTENYCQNLSARSQMLLPTPVNAGDTITLVSAKGSWWDGGENALGFPVWRCPDGSYYFGGNCQGPSTKHVTGTDPMVTAAHMALVLNIGGTYYDLSSGAVTVPGGVTGGTAVVQVNDTDITNNQGDADVCIQVQNNQVVSTTWTHTLDFAVSPNSFVPQVVAVDGSECAWSAGIGFVSGNSLSTPHHWSAWIERIIASTFITSMGITYNISGAWGSNFSDSLVVYLAGVEVTRNHADRSAGTHTTPLTVNSNVDTILIAFGGDNDPQPVITLQQLVITGTGPDPFV